MIGFVLIFEYHGLVDANGDVARLHCTISDFHLRNFTHQLPFLNFEPTDDAEIKDRLAVSSCRWTGREGQQGTDDA